MGWWEASEKRKSIKQEKKLAKEIGADLTPASGATDFAKGDMKKGDFLIESKATDNKSIALNRGWLDKIEFEALRIGKVPLLILEIQGKRYYVFREQEAKDYVDPA